MPWKGSRRLILGVPERLHGCQPSAASAGPLPSHSEMTSRLYLVVKAISVAVLSHLLAEGWLSP